MVLVALKKNMVQKLAQPERNIKVQPNTEYRFLFQLFCSFFTTFRAQSRKSFPSGFSSARETKSACKGINCVVFLSLSLHVRCACWQQGPRKRHKKIRLYSFRRARARKGFLTSISQSLASDEEIHSKSTFSV